MYKPAVGRLGESAFPDVCVDATRVNCGALHVGALPYDQHRLTTWSAQEGIEALGWQQPVEAGQHALDKNSMPAILLIAPATAVCRLLAGRKGV